MRQGFSVNLARINCPPGPCDAEYRRPGNQANTSQIVVGSSYTNVMARVDACPENSTTVTEASKRLGCGIDEFGTSQYLCLPNANLTSLVEFCYDGIMGLQENGSCLQASKRNLILASCMQFSSGCPKAHYKSNDFYKYSACNNINLKHHCYVLDPSCPPNTTEDTNGNTVIYISILAVIVVLVTIFLICVVSYHRRKKRNQSKDSRKCKERNRRKSRYLKKLTDDTLKEIQSLLVDETDKDLIKNYVLTMKNCINANTTTDDVFINVKRVSKLGKTITNNVKSSVLAWRSTCSFLSAVLQESEFSLQKIITLPNQRSKYTEILKDNQSLWRSALGLEASLLHSNNYLTNIKKNASKHLIDTLQNNISEQEIVKFLSTLHSEAEALILKSEVESARLASEFVNVYFKIAILHSVVLWQILGIKLRSACDESSTEGVFSMIQNCETSALNMLNCIIHPLVENAVFRSVFHITDNENVLHFLQIQDIEPLVFDERFYDQRHYIERVSPPCVKLQMKPLQFGVYGNESSTDGCELIFESVSGLEVDNVCYIRSACKGWENYYIQMNSNELCVAVKNRSDSGGKWKCVPLGTDREDQTFIICPIDSPGLFLYLKTGQARGRRDLKKVKEKGLWKICGPA